MQFSIVLFSWEIPILGFHNPVRRFGSKTIRESESILGDTPKAVDGCHSPRRCAFAQDVWKVRQVLECASPLALWLRAWTRRRANVHSQPPDTPWQKR